MKVVYLNLHEVNFLCNTLPQIRSGIKLHTFKHRFIIDYLQESGIQVCDFVIRFHGKGRKEKLARLLIPDFDRKKAEYVLSKNLFKKEIVMLQKKEEIDDGDIVIAYFHDVNQRKSLSGFPGHLIMMGNHFIRIDSPVDFSSSGIEYFVNEVDLTYNQFIKKYFTMGETQHLICPYAFEDRFIVKQSFGTRKNKMMAIGTLSTVEGSGGYELYRKFYGTPWVQPMRKEIMERAREYDGFIDSYVSYIFEDKKKISEDDNFLSRKLKEFQNKHIKWRQSNYTSFDMVDKFNEYRMFACPEEQVGMPGIGFVEGMACGCAYIGLDHEMYRCLGLVPGVHYIAYDGTFADMVEKIKYYQEHEKECKQIAECGTEYVRKHFSQREVAKGFINVLQKLSDVEIS